MDFPDKITFSVWKNNKFVKWPVADGIYEVVIDLFTIHNSLYSHGGIKTPPTAKLRGLLIALFSPSYVYHIFLNSQHFFHWLIGCSIDLWSRGSWLLRLEKGKCQKMLSHGEIVGSMPCFHVCSLYLTTLYIVYWTWQFAIQYKFYRSTTFSRRTLHFSLIFLKKISIWTSVADDDDRDHLQVFSQFPYVTLLFRRLLKLHGGNFLRSFYNICLIFK